MGNIVGSVDVFRTAGGVGAGLVQMYAPGRRHTTSIIRQRVNVHRFDNTTSLVGTCTATPTQKQNAEKNIITYIYTCGYIFYDVRKCCEKMLYRGMNPATATFLELESRLNVALRSTITVVSSMDRLCGKRGDTAWTNLPAVMAGRCDRLSMVSLMRRASFPDCLSTVIGSCSQMRRSPATGRQPTT